MMETCVVKVANFRRRRFRRMFRNSGYKVGVEIGVREGSNSARLLNGVPGLKLYCVDPYIPYDDGKNAIWLDPMVHETIFRSAQDRLLPLGAIFVRKTSADAVKDFPPNSLDFAYIDGNHDYDYVMHDLVEWSDRVRSGGVVAGHDYTDKYRNCGGVKRAVDEFVAVNRITNAYCTTDDIPSFWWVKR